MLVENDLLVPETASPFDEKLYPFVRNKDNTYSNVRSEIVNQDGIYYIKPTMGDTSKHFGGYTNIKSAEKAEMQMHKKLEEMAKNKSEEENNNLEYVAKFNPYTGGISYDFEKKKEKKQITYFDADTGRYVTTDEGTPIIRIKDKAREEQNKAINEMLSTSQFKEGAKTFANVFSDIFIGTPLRALYDIYQEPEKMALRELTENEPETIQQSVVKNPEQQKKIFTKEEAEKYKKEFAEKSRLFAEKYTPQFEISPYANDTSQIVGSITGSVAGMYLAAGLSVPSGIVTGLYGLNSGYAMLDFLLSKDADYETAFNRALMAGVAETVLERISLDTVLKMMRSGWRSPMRRIAIPAITEGGTETLQTAKDFYLQGEYGETQPVDIEQQLAYSFFGGALGGVVGGNISYQMLKGKVSSTLQNKYGYSKPVADKAAEEVILDLPEKTKDFFKPLTDEDIKQGQKAIEEAMNNGGTAADIYLDSKFALKDRMIKAGVPEEKAEREATFWGTREASLWTMLQDKGANISKEEFLKERTQTIENLSDTLVEVDEQGKITPESEARIEEARERIAIMQENGATDEEIKKELSDMGIEDDEILFSMVGEKAILPKKTRTSLDEAKSLEQDGLLNDEQIRQTTGWYKGDDGKWRLEISDKDAKINVENIKETGLKLGDILSHEKLFNAYPELKNVPIKLNATKGYVANTSYNGKEPRIENGILNISNQFIASNEDEQRKTIMHEVQHLIQGAEGFARGGSKREFRSPKMDLYDKVKWNKRIRSANNILGEKNWASFDEAREKIKALENTDDELLKKQIDDFKDADEYLREYDKNTAFTKYSRLAGEIEARNVSERIDLTDEERRKISPEETRDIPREEAIVKFDDGTTAKYETGEDVLFSRDNALNYAKGGYYNKIVSLYKGNSPDTLVHELSHDFFKSYFKLTEQYGLSDRNKAIYEMLGKKSSKEFGTAEWETLTEEFMKYLKTSESPNLASQGLFERAKDWLIKTFYTMNKEETPSKEVKEFFDNLVKDDIREVDLTDLQMTPRTLKEIFKSIKEGNEVGLKGVKRKDLLALQRAIHSFYPRKARTLAKEMYDDDMRIKADSELAKQLGYDSNKKISEQPVFSEKGQIDSMDSLDEYLVEKGLLESDTTENYQQKSDREDEIKNIILQAEDVYSRDEQLVADRREAIEQNSIHASQFADEIIKDNSLGINSIEKFNKYLDEAIRLAKSVDAILVNKNAIDFLFEGMKNAEKENARLEKELKNAKDVIGVRQQLTDYIRKLPLNAQHRLSLLDKVKQVKSGDDFTDVLGKINDSYKTMWEQETKTLLVKNIDKILKSTAPEESKKQYFNYAYNTLFKQLRDINKFNMEKAQAALEQIFDEINSQNKENYVDDGIDDEEIQKVKRELISYKAKGKKGGSVAQMKQLADDLFTLRQEAIEDKKRSDTEKAIQKKAKIDRAVDYLKKHKKVGKVLGFYLKNTNLYSNEAELFGREWAREHEMETVELEQARKVKEHIKRILDKGKEIYGLSNDRKGNQEFAKLMSEKSQENYTLHGVNFPATNVERKISLLQIMDIYNTIKNKNSADIYNSEYEKFDENGNQLTHQIDDLISNLSEQDKKFADELMDDINSLYDEENKIFVKLYGIDMPKHENYWMRSAKKLDGELMDIKRFAYNDNIPSFFKERSPRSLLIPKNAWVKYQKRINDSMYMTNTFEKYKEHYDLIHNNDVQEAITTKYDDKRLTSLTTSLNDLSLSGNSRLFDEMENIVGKAASNWVVSKIALNEAVFAKQLLSLSNFAENMPVTDFVKYELEMLANPKKAFDFMRDFDKDYLDQRFTEGMQNEALANIMANAEKSLKKSDFMLQRYIDLITLPVRLGDVGAIYMGGYARARYLLDHGTPIEKARKIFEFESQQSQQSGLKASMAQFQKHTAFRIITAFKNTQLQYQRKVFDGFIQWRRGEISGEQYAKIVGNYVFLQAFLYQIATNIFSYWRDDDEDKELDLMKDVAMQIVTSPIAGVPFLGDLTQNMLAKNFHELGVAGIGDLNKFLRLFRKSLEDIDEGEFDAKTMAKGMATMLSFVKPMPANILNKILTD